MLNVNVDRNHTTNRTAPCNRPVFLEGAAGLEKYGYGNGFTVMESISRTLLIFSFDTQFQKLDVGPLTTLPFR